MTNEDAVERSPQMQNPPVDAAAEMREIRDRVRQQASREQARQLEAFEGNLDQVRANWQVEPFFFRSSVPVIGPLIAAFRTAWNRVAAKWQVRHILSQQNTFNLTVYRLLQDLCQRTGLLDQRTERLDQRTERLDRRMDHLAREVKQGMSGLDEVLERLEELDLRLISTRSLVSAARAAGQAEEAVDKQPVPTTACSPAGGGDYLGFNARFTARGSVIRKTYRRYLPLFEGRGKVLDAGCGRGHFLELLREIDADGYGVDIDAEMVEVCRLKGLEAQVGDAVNHLSELPEGSLGGIFSGHLIEHLDPPALQRFLALAHRSLHPGGVLVCETPNTRSLYVLANTFYRDPTHQQPVHPETYQFMAQAVGFVDVELRYSLPVPEDRTVEPVIVAGDSDTSLQAMVQEINERLGRIDEQLFGYQNVALIARRIDRDREVSQ